MSFLNSSDNQFCKAKKNSQKKDLISSKLQPYVKFCTNCGHQLEADDLFCDECGTKNEQVESVIIEETKEKNIEKNPVNISSDRMASILETNKIKSGDFSDEFTKPDLSLLINGIETEEQKTIKQLEEKAKILGYYIHKNSYMTQYLIIENIQNDNVKASVKTTFSNGGYSAEFYEGTLSGNELHLHMVDSDLHPPPTELKFLDNGIIPVNYTIYTSEQFDGVIDDEKISGAFKGHYSKTVVFKKC
ncbi:MAG: zinc-ribbon domain-containing protein [Spirochaetaceae bacterium]|nr:zinc-ribbon domain-containing protein [Spirochaetaceae bacterium]